MRKPFQGVKNIIRFNWHFYILAPGLVLFLFFLFNYINHPFNIFLISLSFIIIVTTLISLLVSFYIYDLSGLYDFNWMEKQNLAGTIVNINAGFDETSALLKEKFNSTKFIVLDFYDPIKHTEVSIKRARKAYPAFPGTIKIETTQLPLADNSADKIVVIFSAHEIRNENERLAFFKELKRVINPNGELFLTEHLRDIPNFLAYNIGFFHFYSKQSWIKTFNNSGLKIKKEIKHTPFISTFILYKNDTKL